MTRRILLALLAFTAAVLAGAVVPLTLSTISQDRSSFVQATVGMVRVDAAGKTVVEIMDPRAVLQLVERPEIAAIAGEVRSRLERVLASL